MTKSFSKCYERIIVSFFTGRSETEIKSSDLCICFDIDKRSLFASAFISKYLYPNKSNIITHHHDMATCLLDTLRSLKTNIGLPIIGLFQHPSPTKDSSSRRSIAIASRYCIIALCSNILESAHYVYDFHTSNAKTYWKDNELQKLVISECSKSSIKKLIITDPIIISGENKNIVNHPIFGDINRSGWSKMKKGGGKSFCLKSSIT